MVVSAHPRSRGENPIHTRARLGVAGSSPLTRGKQRVRLQSEEEIGLIPAHAGKTFYNAEALRVYRAHPRSRGENSMMRVRNGTDPGSSPLTRGKRAALDLLDCLQGLIPAHAGKTTSSSLSPSSRKAHPRSRGENIEL